MKPLFFPIALVVLLLAGCETTSPVVDHTFNPEFEPSAYRTFALLPNPHPEWDKGAKAILGEDDLSFIALKTLLEEKGFRYTDSRPVDLLVGLRAEVFTPELPGNDSIYDKILPIRRQTSIDIEGRRGSASGESGMSTSLPAEGQPSLKDPKFTMIVEVFEAGSGDLVWSGTASSATADAFRGGNKRLQNLERLLSRFPN